jgi:hypothetical protein
MVQGTSSRTRQAQETDPDESLAEGCRWMRNEPIRFADSRREGGHERGIVTIDPG